MKHLIAKEHHSHLKKRALIEIAGLAVLIGISLSQHDHISTALSAISQSDIKSLGLLFACYWALLPLTAFSYQLLAGHKIDTTGAALAQLAAAGPGRIIPGGLGHLSIAAVHLRHTGIKLRRAVVITVGNNIFGLTTNIVVIIIALLLEPATLRTIAENISATSVLFASIALMAVVVLLMWLSHARGTRSSIKKVNREWSGLMRQLIKHPHRLFGVISIAIIVIFGHVLMLILAGNAVSVVITVTDAVIALGVGVLMGGALPTPGGIGAVEAGTTTALVVLGYAPQEALSAALLFRAITYWMPLLPGTFAYIYLRKRSML